LKLIVREGALQIALLVAIKKSAKDVDVNLVLVGVPILPAADFGMDTVENGPCESKSRQGYAEN